MKSLQVKSPCRKAIARGEGVKSLPSSRKHGAVNFVFYGIFMKTRGIFYFSPNGESFQGLFIYHLLVVGLPTYSCTEVWAFCFIAHRVDDREGVLTSEESTE